MKLQPNQLLKAQDIKSLSLILPIIFKRWKLFVISLTTIVISLFLFYIVVIPRFRGNSILKEEINKEKTLWVKLQTKLNELEGIDEFLLNEKVSFSLSALSKEKNVMKMLSLLKKLSAENQVFIESIEVNPGTIATGSALQAQNLGLEAVGFSLRIIGGENNLIDYLNGLEKTLPLMNVRSLKITNYGDFSQAQLVVEAYFAPPPREIGKIDSSLARLTEKEEQLLKSLREMKVYSDESLALESLVGTASVNFSNRQDPFAD